MRLREWFHMLLYLLFFMAVGDISPTIWPSSEPSLQHQQQQPCSAFDNSNNNSNHHAIARESIEDRFRFQGGPPVSCSTVLCIFPAPLEPPRLRKCSAFRPLFPPRLRTCTRHPDSQTQRPTVSPQFSSSPPPNRVLCLAGTVRSRLDLLLYAQHNDGPHLGVSRNQQKREKRERKKNRKEKREEEKGQGVQAWFRSFLESILWSFSTSICESCSWCFAADSAAPGGLFFLFRFIVFRICMVLRFILFRVCLLLGFMTLATSTKICAQYCGLKSSVQIALQDDINSYVMVCLWSTHTNRRDFGLRIGGIAAHRVLWFLKFSMHICMSVLVGTFSVCWLIESTSLWFMGAQIVRAHLFECTCWDLLGVLLYGILVCWFAREWVRVLARPRSEDQCSVDPDYWSSLGNGSVIPSKKIVFDTHYRRMRIPGTNRKILMRIRPKSPSLEFMSPRGYFMPGEIILETLPRGAAKSVHRILRAHKRRFIRYWVPAPAPVCPCGTYQGVRVAYQRVVVAHSYNTVVAPTRFFKYQVDRVTVRGAYQCVVDAEDVADSYPKVVCFVLSLKFVSTVYSL